MLNNADHCTVTNNKCYDNKMAIYLNGSTDNVMEYNDCSRSSWDGVALVKSTKNSLNRNIVKYNYFGLVIAESDDNEVTYNDISENTGIGIALMKTNGNKINYNDIYKNTKNGLAGMICFDDAHRNYWGRFRPRFFREVVFLGWVRIFPWSVFRYT
jgi:parallel beta-helix repeat protein